MYPDFFADPLMELNRTAARQLIEQSLEAELNALLSQFSEERTPEGHARAECGGPVIHHDFPAQSRPVGGLRALAEA